MEQLKYFQIIQELNKMKAEGDKPLLTIRILSNIIVNQLAEILDFYLRKSNIPCNFVIGNYDNIIQDAETLSREEVVIIFWEVANITDGFHYLIKNLGAEQRLAYQEKLKNELSIVFSSLKNQKKVFINSFHARPFENGIMPGPYSLFVDEMNNWLSITAPDNFIKIELDGIFALSGLERSFDLRNFFSSKALYTIDFFRLYSTRIIPLIGALTGNVKKVLILDCDNTLWGGIIGEDGTDKISISTPYKMVQSIVVQLYKKGVLVCLCSKNNPDDVQEVLESNGHMILKDQHIVLKKINWDDKVTNILSIADELNLGLSSFIFLDDSSFEINLVKQNLPQVSAYQVPEKITEYPALMEEIAAQFFHFDNSADDGLKTEQYRIQAQRNEAMKSFHSVEDYLRTLGLHIIIAKNKPEQISRIAQLTQKTNQFNLTTKRYSEQDIEFMMNSDTFDFYTLSVKDRFGDSGITGLAIIEKKDNAAIIDTLLLSCRVLGRNVEWVFMDEIIRLLNKKQVNAQFIPTHKNIQVSNFYDQLGFIRINSAEDVGVNYSLNVADYKYHTHIDYIKVDIWKNN
ncbi:MAG: HAD-IIIC family phosphatase [Cyclobacteriaceae bacterium]|nr:HAD-IIIC family phosphatase [Cyclobacteriaceae bacterium]